MRNRNVTAKKGGILQCLGEKKRKEKDGQIGPRRPLFPSSASTIFIETHSDFTLIFEPPLTLIISN